MGKATAQAPDGTVYEYNSDDPVDVMRVAAFCEPSYEVKRQRAKEAFEAAAPEEARNAALSTPVSTADLQKSIADLQATIAKLVSGAAPAIPVASGPFGVAGTPVDPGPLAPVPGATTPVEGSQG